MEWLITNAIAAWLLPPGLVLAALVVGWFLMRRRPRLARGLVGLFLVVFYVLSTPFIAHELKQQLELSPGDPLANKSGEAIVVLGGGIRTAAPEYKADAPGTDTLLRLRYGAHIHRMLGKPVLVTGGAVFHGRSEAATMKAVLENDFQTPVRWAEGNSRNTLENARMSHDVLKAVGIRKIYLVTSAWHMRRSKLVFEHAGFEVIPAATGYSQRRPHPVLDFMPSADALLSSSNVCHEFIGIGWYHLRFILGR